MAERLLVTTDWLHQHLNDPQVRIVDIRGHVAPPTDPLPHYFNHRDDYIKGHIPSAVFIDWVHEITDPADPRHARIAPPERFAEVMGRAGIGDDTLVVAYDDAASMFAARLWWSLNYYGHEKVAVLDGGWNKWIAEDRPVTTKVPQIASTTFVARPQRDWIRTSDEVLAKLNSATKLVDVRSPQEFCGEATRAKRAGHIPGAINLPRPSLTALDGSMLTPEQLRAKFAEAGIDENTPEVVTYCNAGVSASYGLLALHVAGFRNSANYDGSWKEWGNDDSKPIT